MIKFLSTYSGYAIRKEFFEMDGWGSVNEICVKYGHYWVSTTSDAFCKCGRSGCSDVEKMINGVWISISQERGKRKKYAKNVHFFNLSLF